MDARALPHIEIVYADTEAVFTHAQAKSGKRFSLGCEERCDVVVPGEHISRSHAYIETERSDFFLVDSSTNGTFVQTEDERVQFVHRGRVRLWGTGWISLGETLHAGDPVLFREMV